MDNLIQDLRDLAECVELGEWEVPIGLYDALQAAADELEKRRWIPVEESLPETGKEDAGLTPEEVMDLNGCTLVLPCKFGSHLFRITTPYRGERKVTEYIVKNFRTTGKRHRVQIEVQAVGVPGTNWMYYKDFFTSRDEAEETLREDKV